MNKSALEIEMTAVLEELRFQRGNAKLGKNGLIHTWNLPPVTTCPGASQVCLEILTDGLPRCYAMREAFRMSRVQERHKANYLETLLPDFSERATATIRRRHHKVIRWNGTGDWYSDDYLSKGFEIVQATPDTLHYCHTRSHAVAELLPGLERLAGEPNFKMLLSFDRSMAIPPRMRRAGLCYLATGDDDDAPCPVDLVFRDWPRYKPKTIRAITANGSPVCPYETGLAPITCSLCKRCWQGAQVASAVRITALRFRKERIIESTKDVCR